MKLILKVVIGKRYYGRTSGDNKHFCDQLKLWFPEEANSIESYFDHVSVSFLKVVIERYIYIGEECKMSRMGKISDSLRYI